MKKNKNLRYVLRRLLLIFIVLLLGFLALGSRLDGWLWHPRERDRIHGAILSPAKWQELISKFTGN